jgi:hypothetical protein
VLKSSLSTAGTRPLVSLLLVGPAERSATAAEACDYGSAITKARRAAHRLVSAVNGCVCVCVCVCACVCVCVRARALGGGCALG